MNKDDQLLHGVGRSAEGGRWEANNNCTDTTNKTGELVEMNRHYKLAANFNTVEFDILEEDLLQYAKEDEISFDDDMIPYLTVDEAVLMSRVLQQEYDILAAIKVVPAQVTGKEAKEPVEPASEKQIKWALALGMKNPEKASKREVWEFIQKHKDD